MIGPVMLDLAGLSLDPEERDLLRHPRVGGVILFSRNFSSRKQLSELTCAIRALSPTLLIGVDHEGGRVQRFREGFTVVPAMRELGKLYEADAEQALRIASQTGWLIGAELISHEIDISFAPVLDVDQGVSEVIGDRSFSSRPQQIIDLAQALISGMHDAGMAAVGKHFPGHGSVAADSHLQIPEDPRSLAEIECSDMLPFARLSRLLDAVMPAHVIYSEADSKPAGFSRFWLTQVLRGKLGFQGAILSDDLSMEGASVGGTYAERAEVAMEAGCDMVLVCNNRKGAIEVVENIAASEDISAVRLAQLRRKKSYCSRALQSDPRWQESRQALYALRRVDGPSSVKKA